MFPRIAQNWGGRPLESYEVMLNLIGDTTTEKRLKINAELDKNRYPTGIKVADDAPAQVNLEKARFHGEFRFPDLAQINIVVNVNCAQFPTMIVL